MPKPEHIHILGGGIAGLAAGYFAQQYGLPFTIYEAEKQTGGNCRTFQNGEFRFDSGAHRFHDQDPESTSEVFKLFASRIPKIEIPSHIYHHGTFIDFPLSPLNLMKNLGFPRFTRIAAEVLWARMVPQNVDSTFADFALNTYGKTLK